MSLGGAHVSMPARTDETESIGIGSGTSIRDFQVMLGQVPVGRMSGSGDSRDLLDVQRIWIRFRILARSSARRQRARSK